MIKFFRKIRQRLLTENKFSKYLLYAIGEIVLVVIGILIALQINNWNEGRKDRVREKEILNDLKLTLVKNHTILNERTAYFDRGQRTSEIVKNLIDSKSMEHDSIGFYFKSATNGYGGADVISFIGYESLKNNGFNLIKNKSLKDDILQLFETTYRDLISFDDTFVNLNVYYKEVLGTLFYQDANFSLKPFNPDLVLESESFYAILTDYHYNCRWMRLKTIDGFSETQRVLQLLKKELGEAE